MKKSYSLILSLFSLVYIAGMVAASYFKYNIEKGFFGAVIEYLTIPIILMTIILLVVNAIKWSNEKWSFKNTTFFVIIILLLSLGTMMVASIYNI